MPYQKLPKCPRCNSRMIVRPEHKDLWCQVCGFKRSDDKAKTQIQAYLQAGGQSVTVPEYRPTVSPTKISANERQMLATAWSSLYKGDKKTARFILKRLIKHNADLIDGYYLLAMAADNRDERAQYLIHILSIDTHHEHANFELAKLKGIIPADATMENYSTQTDYRQTIDDKIQSESDAKTCPMCGGHTFYEKETEIRCEACGYTRDTQDPALSASSPAQKSLSNTVDYHDLGDALIQRKYGYAHEWVIAKRLTTCQQCGASLTLLGNQMTEQCPFCDSHHVLIQDSLNSFQEPDGIIMAQISKDQVEGIIRQDLPANIQAIRWDIRGIFLPCWSFRGIVNFEGQGYAKSVRLENIIVAGFSEPSERIFASLMPYDLSEILPYDGRYLAQWQASIYGRDAIQASITANAFAKYATLQLAQGKQRPKMLFAPTTLSYDTGAQSSYGQSKIVGKLEYRLLLFPVWMATLHLAKGAYHHVVVNAQTGEVFLTKSLNPQQPISPTQKTRIKPLPPRQSTIRPIEPRPNPSVIRPINKPK